MQEKKLIGFVEALMPCGGWRGGESVQKLHKTSFGVGFLTMTLTVI
jgi:hypothetical protein